MAYADNPGFKGGPPALEIWTETEVDGEVHRELVGRRRAHVRLFNGYDSKAVGANSWPAETTQWTIRRGIPHPFDVKEFEVA